MDFGTFTLPCDRRHALLVLLAHSRMLWLRFYPRQTIAVLTEGLGTAFAGFGGVPRQLLFDQLERPIRYLRESFFHGRTFAKDEDLNKQASRWLEDTANVRAHGTAGERPVARFERSSVGRGVHWPDGPTGAWAPRRQPRRANSRGPSYSRATGCGRYSRTSSCPAPWRPWAASWRAPTARP